MPPTDAQISEWKALAVTLAFHREQYNQQEGGLYRDAFELAAWNGRAEEAISSLILEVERLTLTRAGREALEGRVCPPES